MKNYITQYKVLFSLSWVVLYLFFPTWRFPGSRSDHITINIFMVYFTIASYLTNHYFNFLVADKPVFIKINIWGKNIRDNLSLIIFCVASALLHIFFNHFTSVIIMGEEQFLRQAFWIYDFLSMHWHKLFDFPIQYFFWSLIVLIMFLLKRKKNVNDMSGLINANFSINRLGKLAGPFGVFIIFGLFNFYVYLFPYYSLQESTLVLRYPPVSRLIYLIIHTAFGISEIGPRIVQFIFYILGAVYLYRTILLFNEKEAALLGATIYLFSPILFHHATFASTGSGVTFFIILISYYFLRFVKEEDNRDLLLCTFFIGLGFLYKEEILVMFIICFAYLFYSRIKSRNWSSLLHFKILSLSLIPVLPWLKIGPGNYQATWHNLISPDSLNTYFQMIQNQLSLIIFSLFIVAFFFVLFTRRDDLSLFFGLLFVAYYVFFTLKYGVNVHRYSLALYPAINVLLAQFIFIINQKISWKQSFKLVYLVLTVYLIIICLIPRSSSSLVTYNYNDFEYQKYPFDKTLDWVRDITDNEDRILVFYLFQDFMLYTDRIYEDRSEIRNRIIFLPLDYKDLFLSENVKQYYSGKKISYFILPYSPKATLLPQFENLQEKINMMNHVRDKMGNEFIEVAKFSHDDNYILVYKIKDRFMYIHDFLSFLD